MMVTYKGYKEVAIPLHRRRLQCLPARGKVCFFRGWPRYGEEEIDRVEFEVMAARYQSLNTALIMGPYTPLLAIDIDIDGQEGSAAEQARAFEAFGSTPLVRHGSNSRMMLFYRKVPGADYTERRGRAVELYCDSGLVILYGVHPSGDLYRWPVGNPLETPLEEAPVVSPEQLEAYFEGVPEKFIRCKVKDVLACQTESAPIQEDGDPVIEDLPELVEFVFRELFAAELKKFGITPGSPAGLRMLEMAEQYVEWEVKA